MKRAWRLLAIGGLLLLTPKAVAKQTMTMAVSPAQSMAPAHLSVRFTIEPNSDNRALVVIADSGDYFRSSVIPLEGERAPKTILVEYPSLPGGDYEVRGTLTNLVGRELAAVSREVIVIPTSGAR